MSNKKKQKQNHKKMSQETKDNIRTGFATLLSNEACVQASRHMHGLAYIVPVTIGLLSVVLAILPTFVSRINVEGSAVVFPTASATSSGNYEQGLAYFTYDLIHDKNGNRRDIEVYVDDNGVPHFTADVAGKTKNAAQIINENDEEKWLTYTRGSDNHPAFAVFFNDSAFLDSDFFRAIDAGLNPYVGYAEQTLKVAGSEAFPCSYIAFGKETIRFRKRNSVTANVGLTGRYDRMHGVNFTSFARELTGLEAMGLNETSAMYLIRVHDFYKKIVNLSYETDKVSGAWQYTGIFAAVDLGLLLLFGLVLFLMTRGKKNPYRIYNIWNTIKIACWASLTPAVLALALGFWLVQYGFIIFMFLYGMRMMWLSMKTFRPSAA